VKKVAFCTFGCRLNYYDTETVRTLLERDGGWTTVPMREEADVYVVNTCSVTSQADARARQAIRRLRSEHPAARIVVTGCYAQRAPEEIAELPGVSLILGAADRASIARELDQVAAGGLRTVVSPIEEATSFLEVPIAEMMERSRALVKVQEGCDERCSFCIVPQTRGRSRSREPSRVLAQVRGLVERGYTEIVVTGVHLGAYGMDLESRSCRLPELIELLLRVPGLERLRVSSIEPSTVTAELIELMASEAKFARHFHIPLQSASDEVLARMGRAYRGRDFVDLVHAIAGRVPGCGIGTDVIAGFPGETEEDFAKTFDCLGELPISYLHPFTYSVRPGSAAPAFGDQVAGDVKKRRTRALKRLSRDKNRSFRESHLGTEVLALLERDEREPMCRSGWTDNYLRVEVPEGPPEPGLGRIRITALSEAGLVGRWLGRARAD
jgi:threonylcarbamoyladenosine tRNA methylthiotransferase MtaB